jgi:hypothetical protein
MSANSIQARSTRLIQRLKAKGTVDPLISPFLLLSTAEAADISGLTTRKIEQYRREGGGPPFLRLSRRCVRYRLLDLVEWQDGLVRLNNCDLSDGEEVMAKDVAK